MAIRKTVEIDGRPVTFAASSATPRLYRNLFRRDIMADMDKLMNAIDGQNEAASSLSTIDLEIFENVAFTMAKQAEPGIPDDVLVWLDGFNMFSIYLVLPHIIELWALNMETMSDAKKNLAAPTGH